MDGRWTKGINDPEEKREAQRRIIQCRDVLDKLYDMLELKQIGSAKVDYDSPSWSHKQADTLGYNRALTEVMNLIDIEEKQ